LLNCNVKAELARRNLADFIQYVKPAYQFKDFHLYIISRLEAFERGEIKKLMIFMPPQHGKSELTSRLFPAYLLGKKASRKIVVSSYSATIAHEFARDIKNNINSPEYQEIFKTKIGRQQDTNGSFSDSSYYFHTAPEKGFIYAVGRGGSLTSKTVDIGIIDDPLKGREEAMSYGIRDKMYQWYINDYRTRMHNDSQELLIQTRWDMDDLAGRLLKSEPDKWEVINFPAIKTEDFSEYDKRTTGEVLYPEKHSLERILDIKSKSEVTFNSLYQQDPKPNSNTLVHPNFVAIDRIPTESITKWIIGIDYGYTNDPTAIVAIGVWNNKRYWKRLVYQKESSGNRTIANVTPQQIKDVLISFGFDKCAIYSEHDKEQIAQLRRLGLPIQLANKSIYAGIQKVNEFENYYEAHDRIIHDEIVNYQFQTIGEIILNDPIDGNDHIMNAGRYAIYTDIFK
jgi:hypothetical protein